VQVNRPLRDEFAEVLGRFSWEIALLQEAPPRWLESLARRCRASAALALTSRNWVPALQGALAEWNPDLIASSEGGSNMLLVRAPARIAEVRRLTLARHPERRRMLFARVEAPGERVLCVANMHLSTNDEAAAEEMEHAGEQAVEWAGADPLIFGGDLNIRPDRSPDAFAALRDRFGLGSPTADDLIDHLLVRGMQVVDPTALLEPEEHEVERADGLRIRLSDHAPITASFGMK
jgi:endonuclease/exonuclease/phosphatase family metal-dependent hydrolase